MDGLDEQGVPQEAGVKCVFTSWTETRAPSFLKVAGIDIPTQMQGVDQTDVFYGNKESIRSHIFVENIVPSQYSSKGRLPIGIRHFGQSLVKGLRRFPLPAASRSALTSLNFLIPDNRTSLLSLRRCCLVTRQELLSSSGFA